MYPDLIEFTMDSKRQTVSKGENGTWRNSNAKLQSHVKSREKAVGTLTFTVKIPKKCKNCPKGKGKNPVIDWFNECLSDAFTENISERDEKLYLKCGENEVSKDLITIGGKSEQNVMTSTLLDFNKGLSISMNNMKLATNDFDLGKATKSMTEGEALAAGAFRLDLNFNSDEEIIKPQENKNVLTVPFEVTKVLNTIVKYETKKLNGEIKKLRNTRNKAVKKTVEKDAMCLEGAPPRVKKAKDVQKTLVADKQTNIDGAIGNADNKKNIKSPSAGEEKEDTSEKTDNSKDKSTTVATHTRGCVTKMMFRKQVEIYLKRYPENEVPVVAYNKM